MHTVLEVRALDKTFPVGFLRRRRQVLFGIDLTLGAGESVGLCGPNGSGKSTLLRCLAGVERPSAGTLALFGSTPDDPGARARVGFLPDASPFPAELSARDALQLLASLHGFSAGERERRVERGLATVGLAADANRALGRYSKGMLRRFGLAQAFLADPDLVLLDEPTAGLDATGHAVLEELIADARERGATLVIASHDVADVTLFTERVCVLIDGRIAADGPATELVEAEGRTRLEVEGLERTELVTLEAEVGRLGGRVVASGPATGTLAALYRRLSARAGEKA